MCRVVLIVSCIVVLPFAPAARAQDKQAEELRLLREEIAKLVSDFRARDQALQAELQRRQQEVRSLQATLTDREAMLLRLQKEKEEAQRDAVTARFEAESLRARTENLLGELKRAQQKLATLEAGGKPTIMPAIDAVNPPHVEMKGKVTKLDERNPDLVIINLGVDHGLKVNHTLEAFRLKPEPRYLGHVRIIEVMPTQAIGRLVPPRGMPLRLEVGDEVISRLSSR